MRKISLIGFVMLIVSIPTFAGGLLTNTNQHVAFLRMLARGASIDIDGVYSNPAGLAFLPGDGLYLSLNGQSAYQTRNIDMTFPLFPEDGHRRYYKGKASAPFIPSFQGAYKKGDWTISGSFAVGGGGGKASFDDGLGMFDSMVMGQIYQAASGKVTPNMYTINSAMDGSQFIYGVQLGLSYKVNDWLGVFAGGRMNYFSGGYEGFLTAKVKADLPGMPAGTELAGIELDCDQTGWGLTPIIGVDAKFGKLNLAAKYEFKANMNIENNTHKLEFPDAAAAYMAPYQHGVNTPSDLPSMLSVAASYEFLPSLRASVEYHFFDDKNAGMADNKQKTLKHGTHEYLAGVEWDINKIFTVSGGYQKTDYGLSDAFQTDTSFSCDSYSVGLGGRINLSKALSLDVAYFWTTYSDYTKENPRGLDGAMASMDKDVYSRTNKVFGVSVNYKF